MSMCQLCPEGVQITGTKRGGCQSSGISSGISNHAALIVFLARILWGGVGGGRWGSVLHFCHFLRTKDEQSKVLKPLKIELILM